MRARPTAALAVATLALLAGCGRASHTAAVVRVASTAPAAIATVAVPSVPAAPARPPAAAVVPAAPPIHRWPIPFGSRRRSEMAAYSLLHYGEHTATLSNPKVIVEHYTDTAGAEEAFNTFAADVPDSELHQLPGTCAHFIVERSGRIDQLVALSLRCRHTVGLNWTAIGIEHVGFSDQAILGDQRQLAASLALTRWLRCRYRIALKNVIGHNESLSSPFHHELVPALRHQTHSDWNHADMTRYRALLARLPCPAAP